MEILTTATQTYMQAFGKDIDQFLKWGQWLFFGLLTMNLSVMFLGYAFEKESFVEGMADFIRKFFVIALFYTLMLHHSWLLQALKSAEVMGTTLTGNPTDPSSIIAQGIGIANKVLAPVQSKGLLTIGFGALVILITYVVILFAFISIALQLAITMILTTALISAATFFLGFAALSATSQIARNTLDAILANCVKLLGIYLVVAAGSKTIMNVENAIPVEVGSFDIYAWLLATVFLFWLLAKNLPDQFARLISHAVSETRGHDAAAIAMSSVQIARNTAAVQSLATAAARGGLPKAVFRA